MAREFSSNIELEHVLSRNDACSKKLKKAAFENRLDQDKEMIKKAKTEKEKEYWANISKSSLKLYNNNNNSNHRN